MRRVRRPTRAERCGAAFKEGWADFIARVALRGADVGFACSDLDDREPDAAGFPFADGSLACPVAGVPCIHGQHFFDDVEQALRDLYDPADDEPVNLSLPEMVDDLGLVLAQDGPAFLDFLFSSSEVPVRSQLGLCDFAEAVVTSGVAVADVEAALAATLIECGL